MRQLIVLLVAYGVCGGLGDVTRILADEPATERPAKQEPVGDASCITLSRCRVKLIDQVTLASDQIGILDFVEPEEGDRVRAKQQIAGLKDDLAQAMYAIAKKKAENDIQKRYSRKAADLAATELLKAQDANRQLEGTVPDIEIQRLQLALEKSQLSVELADDEYLVAQLEAREAEARLKMYRLEAPFDGVVTQIYKRKGEAVRQGDPILELVNTDRVRVEGRVEIKDVWKMQPGMTVHVRLDIPDIDLPAEQQAFEGRVVFVDVTVQPVTREVRVWAEVANANNILKDGLTATMTIDVDKKLVQTSQH